MRRFIVAAIVIYAVLAASHCCACPCQPKGTITAQVPTNNSEVTAGTVYFGHSGQVWVTPGSTGAYFQFTARSVMSGCGDPSTRQGTVVTLACGGGPTTYTMFSSWDYNGGCTLPADMTVTSSAWATKIGTSELYGVAGMTTTFKLVSPIIP